MAVNTPEDFHNEIHKDVGTPIKKVIHVRKHKHNRIQQVSKEHGAEWATTKVDFTNKTVKVDVYVDFQQNALTNQDYNTLRNLASAGIKNYWSRQIKIGGADFLASVNVFHRKNKSIDVDLYVATSINYQRSYNSGLIDASLFYNKGFYRGWNSQANADFMMVAAHEFGHSVLDYFGGKNLSWAHKGSTNKYLQNIRGSIPGYPVSGEIDLMKYYDQNKSTVTPTDNRMRSLAHEQDVKRLIWLSDLSL